MTMWKLWHRLAGTRYVVFEFGYGEYVRRVRFTLDGKPYVKVCGTHCWLVGCGERWHSLTFDKGGWLKGLDRPADCPLTRPQGER